MISTPTSPAIYARISRDKKNDQKAVQRQNAILRMRAEELGWPQPVLYEDDDRASKEGVEREAFDRLMRDLRAGIRDGILVYKADRYSREPEHYTILKKLGTPFVTEAGSYNPSVEEDFFNLRVEAASGERETARLSRRLLAQRQQAAQLGERHGQRAFGWGSGVENGHVIDGDKINIAEAAVVREGLQAILEGRSLVSITKDWNDRGIKTARGNGWKVASVRGVLERWSNAGVRQYQGQPLFDAPSHCEPITDLDTVKQVRALLANNPRNNTKSRARKHLLSGIIRCQCGATMKAQSIGSYAHRYPEQRQPDGHLVPTHYKCEGRGCGRSVLYADANDHVLRTTAQRLLWKRPAHFLPTEARAAVASLSAELVTIGERREKIHAAEISEDDKLLMLTKIKKDRDRAQAQLDAYAASSKLAALVDGLVSFQYRDEQGRNTLSWAQGAENLGTIKARIAALDLRQQKDLLLALATYEVGPGFDEPDETGKRRKLKASERIEITPR